MSTQIRYRIDDVIKLTNSVQDVTHSLKSVARFALVSLVSKMNISKFEVEKSYLKQDVIVSDYIFQNIISVRNRIINVYVFKVANE